MRKSGISNLVFNVRKHPELASTPLFVTRFSEFSLADSLWVLNSRRKWEEEKKFIKVEKINTITNLCLSDVQRQLHLVDPNHIVDILCLAARVRGLDPFVIDSFISKFFAQQSLLNPRKLSLGLWAVSRIAPSRIVPFLDTLNGLSTEYLVRLTARDKALLTQSLVRSVSCSGTPRASLETVLSILERFEMNFTSSSIIEASSCLLSLAKLKEIAKKLNAETTLVNDLLPSLLIRVSNLLRTNHCSDFSAESLLSIAWAFAILRYKSQPVLVDLYRNIYAKINSMRTDQRAFAFFLFASASGLNDETIRSAFVQSLTTQYSNLSNHNLINFAVALGRLRIDNKEILEHLFSRNLVLKPAQRLSCLAVAATRIGDSESPAFVDFKNSLMSESRIAEFTVSEIVKLMRIDALTLDQKWNLQNVLLRRFKELLLCDPNDLLLLAEEIRKLGPQRVKVNLRMRFNKFFVKAIHQRVFPTPILLSNLKLVDDIGAWHCLPYSTQCTLWNKASELQKIDVRHPADPLRGKRRRLIPSDKLLVHVDDYFADANEKEIEVANRVRNEKEEKDSEIELEEISDGETPIAKFIQIVRRM